MLLYGRFSFKKFSGGDTPGLPLPGGGGPLPDLPQHGLRPCARALAPRILRPPRIKNPPRIWAGYGPVTHTWNVDLKEVGNRIKLLLSKSEEQQIYRVALKSKPLSLIIIKFY